jgi:hypothetical protein
VVEMLLAAGIDDFVNLTQDRPGGTDAHLRHYDGAIGDRGTVSRFEIPDLGVPSVSEMTAVLGHLYRKLDGGVRSMCTAGVESVEPARSWVAG